MTEERFTIIEPRNDSTSLIRGTGILAVLGQFAWAVNDRAGVVIPTSKAPVARAALAAAGWTIDDGDQAAPPRPATGRMPLPLPECANCHQPYRRAAAARAKPTDHCIRCGHRLVLIQEDPNADAAALDTIGACPDCGRTRHRTWRYCPCGAEVDEPQLFDPQTATDRVAEFAQATFTIPEE